MNARAKRSKLRRLKWLERKKMKKKDENQIIGIDLSDIRSVEKEGISSSMEQEGENQLIIRVRRTAELISCSSGSPAEDEFSGVVVISSDSEDADGLDQMGPRFPETGQGLIKRKDVPFRIRPTQDLVDNVINLCSTSPNPLTVPSGNTSSANLHSSDVAISSIPFKIRSAAEITGSGSNVSSVDAAVYATSPAEKSLLNSFDQVSLEKSGIPFRIRATTELMDNPIEEKPCDVPNPLSPNSVEEASIPFRKSTTSELASDSKFGDMPGHATTLTEEEKQDNVDRNSQEKSCDLLRILPGLVNKTGDASSHELPARSATASPGETVKNDSCQNSDGKSSIPFRVRSTTELLEKTSAVNPCDAPIPGITLLGGPYHKNSNMSNCGISAVPFRVRATVTKLRNESYNAPSKVQTLLGRVAGKSLSSAVSRAGQSTNLVTLESSSSSPVPPAALCALRAKDSGRVLGDQDQLSSSRVLPDAEPEETISPSNPATLKNYQPIDADGNLQASVSELTGYDIDPHPKPSSTGSCYSVASKPSSNQAHVDVEAESSIAFSNSSIVEMQSSATFPVHENFSAAKPGSPLSPTQNEITTTSPKRPSYFYTETPSLSPWSIFIAKYWSREPDWYHQKEIHLRHPHVAPLGQEIFSLALAGPHKRTKKSTKRKCFRTRRENEIIDHYNEVTNRLWELNQMKKTGHGAHCMLTSDVIPSLDKKLWKQLKVELSCLQVELQRKLMEERTHKRKGTVGNGLEGARAGAHKSKEWEQSRMHPLQRHPDHGAREMGEGESRICYGTSAGDLIGDEIPEPAQRSQTGSLPNLPHLDSKRSDRTICNDIQMLDSVEVMASARSTSRRGLPVRDEMERLAPDVESHGLSNTDEPLDEGCHDVSGISGNASGSDRDAVVAPCTSIKTQPGAKSLSDESAIPAVSSPASSDSSNPSGQVPVVDGNVAVCPHSPGERPLAVISPELSAAVLSVASKNVAVSDVKVVKTDRNVAPPKLPWTALSDTSWDALYR